MNCTNCGKELEKEFRFCPYCRKPTVNDKAEAVKKGTLLPDKKSPAEKNEIKWRGIICASVVIIIITAFVGISIYNTTENRIQRQLDLGYGYEQKNDYEAELQIYDRLIRVEGEDEQILAEMDTANDDMENEDTENGDIALETKSDRKQFEAEETGKASADWYDVYRDFICDDMYWKSGYDFDRTVDCVGPMVSLYDFDQDEVPELLITNGYSGRIDRWTYIFTCENGELKYLDIGPTDAFFVENAEYSGVYGCLGFGNAEWYWTYYWKEGDAIKSEYVFQEYYDWGIGDYVIAQQTDNDKLFAESQKEKISLYEADVSDIKAIGWDYFVVSAGMRSRWFG